MSDRTVSEGASEVELGLTELVYCGLMAACTTGVLGMPGALGRLGSLRLGMGTPCGDACCSLGVTPSMDTLHDEFGLQMCRDTFLVYKATRRSDDCMCTFRGRCTILLCCRIFSWQSRSPGYSEHTHQFTAS